MSRAIALDTAGLYIAGLGYRRIRPVEALGAEMGMERGRDVGVEHGPMAVAAPAPSPST